MPHSKMQEYVNVDYRKAMSIVGLIGEPGQEHIIAEARFVKERNGSSANIAFVVDEKFQGLGIGKYLYAMLVRLAKKRGIQRFTAEVLATNKKMMRVFEKGSLPVNARLESGEYDLSIPLDAQSSRSGTTIHYEHMG